MRARESDPPTNNLTAQRRDVGHRFEEAEPIPCREARNDQPAVGDAAAGATEEGGAIAECGFADREGAR